MWSSNPDLPGLGLYTADKLTFPLNRKHCPALRWARGPQGSLGVQGERSPPHQSKSCISGSGISRTKSNAIEQAQWPESWGGRGPARVLSDEQRERLAGFPP